MHERSDEQVMAAVMAGDQAALAALVTRHHSPLLGYLSRLTGGDRPLAEDLVQETFLRVLRQGICQPDRPFKPWLYAIATNLARDHFKSAAMRLHWQENDAEERCSTSTILLLAQKNALWRQNRAARLWLHLPNLVRSIAWCCCCATIKDSAWARLLKRWACRWGR